MFDPDVMRKQICDHLASSFSNRRCSLLFDRSPREAVQVDYVEQQRTVRDRNYRPVDGQCDDGVGHIIYSYEQWVSVMRQPKAAGDDIVLAAFHDLLRLIVVMLEQIAVQNKERQMRCVFDIGDSDSFRSTGLSSEMSVVFVNIDGHYNWAHRTTDNRDGDYNVMAERFLFTMGIPIHDIFKGKDRSTPQEQMEPFRRKLRALPHRQLEQAARDRARRRMVKEALLHVDGMEAD